MAKQSAPASSFKKMVIGAVAALFVLQLISFGLLARMHHAVNTKIDETKQLVNIDMDSVSQQLSLSVLPKENKLYLPELNLTVPFNQLNRSLRYTYEEGTTNNVRITSAQMIDHGMHVQSCNDMVRLRIEDKPDAYSPSQPSYATVPLSDGRKLQVYASTTKECRQAWMMSAITPQAIAEQFKAATLYQ